MKRLYLILSLFLSTNVQAIKHYYVTAATSEYFGHLLNLIGSIHRVDFEQLEEIAVFDLGLSSEERAQLLTIEKIKIYDLEEHPNRTTMLTRFQVPRRRYFGWYAWKPVIIKQALQMFPYVLWLDAGTTVLRPINHLFEYINDHGHFVCTIGNEQYPNGNFTRPMGWQTTRYVAEKFDLYSPEHDWILEAEAIMAGILGFSAKALDYLVLPWYELTFDMRNFIDDGSAPDGYGTVRPEQTLLGILIYKNNLTYFKQDHMQRVPMKLPQKDTPQNLFITWHQRYVCRNTHIWSSRWDLRDYVQYIRYKKGRIGLFFETVRRTIK